MHIFFSGIGGVGIGPLAQITKQAGYEVSGSDARESQYLKELGAKGITEVHVGQSAEKLAELHGRHPIDWLVHTSAVKADNPELVWARENGIRVTKRDEFINYLLEDKGLKLIAIAGTHGKTTTTAMVVWLFKQLGIPVSYSVGAKLSFGEMGEFDPSSEYFVYEADEFDRNFLAYKPDYSLITGVSWDHHEIFPTREDYQSAFREFIGQSHNTVMWQEDAKYLTVERGEHITLLDNTEPAIEGIALSGHYNRLDAFLAVLTVRLATMHELDELLDIIDAFPGLHRRLEEIAPGIYSDEAHTPDKIRGCMSAALETAAVNGKEVVVVYEPLTNRRQHYLKDDYKDCFKGAKRLYWLPSYLAREDPQQPVLAPEELIKGLTEPSLAQARKRDESLKATILQHLSDGDMVVCMAGGGGDSLDEWARKEFGA